MDSALLYVTKGPFLHKAHSQKEEPLRTRSKMSVSAHVSNDQFQLTSDIIRFLSSGCDTMLATVTAVVRFAQYYGSISPTPLENTSAFSTWQPDTEANISKPHKCLQVLYEDIGDSRYSVAYCRRNG